MVGLRPPPRSSVFGHQRFTGERRRCERPGSRIGSTPLASKHRCRPEGARSPPSPRSRHLFCVSVLAQQQPPPPPCSNALTFRNLLRLNTRDRCTIGDGSSRNQICPQVSICANTEISARVVEQTLLKPPLDETTTAAGFTKDAAGEKRFQAAERKNRAGNCYVSLN